MSLYRIICNNFQSRKFLPWIFLMEISQHIMMSVPSILESHRMKLWQEKFHNSSAYVKKLMGSFVMFMHLFSCLPTLPSFITALYAKNTASISTRCSLQVRKTQSISIPSSIIPNVRILTSAPSTVTTTITLICPGETTKFITVQKPIHIL